MICPATSGPSPMCQASSAIPTFGSPTSSMRATTSGIVVMNEKSSNSVGCISSTPTFVP